jgi:hypothetical protein
MTIGLKMHGVSLTLSGDYPRLLDYVASLMADLVVPPVTAPDLEVQVRWLRQPMQKGTSLFPHARSQEGLGKRMLVSTDELVWVDTYRDQNLQLRFRRVRGRLVFDVAYCYQPSAKKLAKYPDYEQKTFFDLMRYLVLFPIAWHLERTRGWGLIHASAVADRHGAILVAGPGGAGKTTTCIGLAAREGIRLVAENLVFCDGQRIYPVLEPVRLTDESLRLLGDRANGLRPLPGSLKRKAMFQLDGAGTEGGVPTRAVFVPKFSPKGFVEPLSPGIACELLLAANRLTLEVNDYYWYSAALDLMWPKADNSAAALAVFQRLSESADSFMLGIDRTAGVDAVVDRILACLGATQRSDKFKEPALP